MEMARPRSVAASYSLVWNAVVVRLTPLVSVSFSLEIVTKNISSIHIARLLV